MNKKGFLRTGYLVLATLMILSCNLCFSQYTITNGHFDNDVSSWDAFQGTATWQAINSSGDTSPTPGSAVFTLTSTVGSLSLRVLVSRQRDKHCPFMRMLQGMATGRVEGSSSDFIMQPSMRYTPVAILM